MAPVRIVAVVLSVVTCTAATVSAQIVQVPPRVYRGLFNEPPPDPTRMRQEVVISTSLLGSYDTNLNPTAAGTADLFTPRPDGYSGVGDLRLRYWRGVETAFVELTGGGGVFAYQGLDVKPEFQGTGQARWTAPIGQRNQISGIQEARLEPFYALGTFAPLFPGFEGGSGPSATSGFAVRRSRSLSSNTALRHSWSRRNASTVQYNFSDRSFEDNIGDTRMHMVGADFERTVGRGAAFRASYQYTDSTNLNADGSDRPLDSQTINVGYSHEKPLSPSRRLLLSFGAGATHVDTLSSVGFEPLTYWLPSGFASMRVDWARSWSLWLDYSRRVSVIEGLTVEPFATDALMVRTGGLVQRRIELVLLGSYANGQAAPDSTGQFDTYSGGTQLRFFAGQRYSFLLSHTFYAHRLNEFATLPEGVVSSINQNIVRVGFTLDLPVYGRYPNTVRP
jgi:hypothetical protein